MRKIQKQTRLFDDYDRLSRYTSLVDTLGRLVVGDEDTYQTCLLIAMFSGQAAVRNR